MNAITELSYRVDLARGVQLTRMSALLSTGDEHAHRLSIEILRNGVPVDLSGITVSGGFVRADDQTVLLNGEVSGGKVMVTLSQACYRIEGPFGLAVRVTQGKDVSTVFYGRGAVTRTETDAVIDPDKRIPSLQELLDKIAQMEQATAEAKTVTGAARTATEQANTARDGANKAAEGANNAKKGAEDAAGKASSAAGAADASADRANKAASRVEEVTQGVNDAIEKAEKAAANADSKAQEVRGAAELAQGAAEAAVGAAEGAAGAAAMAEGAAGQALEAARAAAKWGNATVTVSMLGQDEDAFVTVMDTETGKEVSFLLPRGLTGLTPKLTTGEVITGEPGSDVQAWLTGTSENPVLNLSIPQGMTGRIENLTVCGVAADGSGNIALTADDVGALPDDGVAGSAKSLETARKICVDLASADGADFDGTNDVKPGVAGVLGIEHGGTEAETADEALEKLGGAYGVGSTLPWTDTTRMICLGRFMASTSYLYINLSLCKPFRGVPRITSFEGVVYGDGKSVSISSSNSELDCSIAAYNGELGSIYITIVNSHNFFAAFKDNVPVGVVFTDLGITFNDGGSVSADTGWFEEAT